MALGSVIVGTCLGIIVALVSLFFGAGLGGAFLLYAGSGLAGTLLSLGAGLLAGHQRTDLART